MGEGRSGTGRATGGPRLSRRRLLQAAGATGVGLLGAHAALAGSRRTAGPAPATAEAVGQDAIDALAADLDYDLTSIFRHIADEVWYEPYAGSLRGAGDTLAGGAGNSVDKAALLAALLQSALFETRFVSGTLDDAAANALLATTSVTRDVARARASATLTGTPEGAVSPGPSARPGLPGELQSVMDHRDELVATADAWASDHLDSGVTTVLGALAGAGIDLATPVSALPDLERTRHVWVQARQGADWLDLDPSLPGSQPGQTSATATGDPFAAIPDELRHQVHITLTADVVSGATLTQQPLLDALVMADALDASAMTLLHERPDGLQSIGISIGSLFAGGEPHYQPLLVVGDDIHVGQTLLSMGGGGSDPFGGGPGSRDGAAVAEWLEVAVTGPDGASRTARRAIFDLVGAEARAAGAVDVASIPVPELTTLGADAKDQFLPLTDLWYLSVATGPTSLDSLETPGDEQLDEVASAGLSAPLYHVARDAGNALLALDRGVRTVLDGPNVTAFTIGATVNDDGTFDVRTNVDLLHRRFGTMGVEDVPAAAPGAVVAGVLSHVVERLQAGEGLGDLGLGQGPVPSPVSAGAIVEAAQTQGIGLRVLRDAPPADLAWPAAAAARLAEALAAGWVAIAPASPVAMGDEQRLGWWLVDPITGATIDQLDTGGGQTMAEYGQALKRIWLNTRPYLCLGITVAEHLHLIHDLVEGHLGGALVGAAAGKAAHHVLGCH